MLARLSAPPPTPQKKAGKGSDLAVGSIAAAAERPLPKQTHPRACVIGLQPSKEMGWPSSASPLLTVCPAGRVQFPNEIRHWRWWAFGTPVPDMNTVIRFHGVGSWAVKFSQAFDLAVTCYCVDSRYLVWPLFGMVLTGRYLVWFWQVESTKICAWFQRSTERSLQLVYPAINESVPLPI